MIKRIDSARKLQYTIVTSVMAACKSLSTLPQLSETDKFYWHLIALCCNHVQPNAEKLDELIIHRFIVIQLSKIYHNYCDRNKESSKLIHKVPDHISNFDVKNYFKWIINMQKIITHWQGKFKSGEFNYDDIFIYAINLDKITVFAEAMHVEHLACSSDEIFEIKREYSILYADLCLLLVKNTKDSGW